MTAVPSPAGEQPTEGEKRQLMIRCWVCGERKPEATADVIKTAGGFGRARRCQECSR